MGSEALEDGRQDIFHSFFLSLVLLSVIPNKMKNIIVMFLLRSF
jgi:hypothetical protein